MTLVNRVADRVCPLSHQHDMLEAKPGIPHTSRCILHARGDHRDHLDVLCSAGEGTVKVDGDDSHFLESEGLTADRRQALLERIAAQRINADETAPLLKDPRESSSAGLQKGSAAIHPGPDI